MSNREDKELQIRLAEMQMDLQIKIAYFFGLEGIIIGMFVGSFQVAIALQNISPYASIVLVFLMGVLLYFFIITANHYEKKIEAIRRETRNLRKEYAW